MPVSNAKEERMWRLADELAESGQYSGWLAIEWELRSRGYPRARHLLDSERTREHLDRKCAEVRRTRAHA